MLTLENISKSFDGQAVLQHIDLSVSEGEILCLLGPSGCGKTTLLRIVAGLETAENGTVRLNGDKINGKPAHQRGFGLMFQDFALFPHMNVRDNIAFGLQMAGQNHHQQNERVQAVLDLVGLAQFGGRRVTALSGGEQQRVALARSLAPSPKLLMLDEPLGSLDAALRERLVAELRRILKAAGMTAIYVTHDQSEAYAIADRITVMNAGHIEQIDAPEALYLRPQSRFTAGFLGLSNILPVAAITARSSGYLAQTALGAIPVAEPCEHVLLHPAFLTQRETGILSLEMWVKSRAFKGGMYQLNLVHHSGTGLIMYHPTSLGDVPHDGETIQISIRAGGVLPLA